MHRRTLLKVPGLALLGAGSGTFAACGDDGRPTTGLPTPTEEADVAETSRARYDYGDDPSQYGELFLPAARPRGVVVVVHGGFWQAEYDADSLGTPVAQALAADGWAAWNLEYRRVGNGGGNPGTFDDVAAGIDHLATLEVDTSTVVTLGHSAGGHLAAWAAGRGRYGWTDEVPVTHVISQAGVLDLLGGAAAGLGDGAIDALLGHAPTTDDERFDPAQQIPLDVPVWCVHGPADAHVPISQSTTYVERARAAGAQAELVEVDGDHFAVIDPATTAWARQVEILDLIG